MTRPATADPSGIFRLSFTPPTFETPKEEQLHRKQRLAATFRLFAKFGYDEGVAGHVTCRDPIDPSTFCSRAPRESRSSFAPRRQSRPR